MKQKAFTLVELLIVVVIIGVVYGLYFTTMPKSKKHREFKLVEVKSYLYDLSKELRIDKLTLICSENSDECFILDDKHNVLSSVKNPTKVKVYHLKEDEQLDIVRYNNVELKNGEYFTPSLIYKKLSKTKFETLIYYNDNDEWVYISPYFDDAKKFINKEEIVAYIKKKAYLPMYGGDAR